MRKFKLARQNLRKNHFPKSHLHRSFFRSIMKQKIFIGFIFSLLLSISVLSQSNLPTPTPTRQRVVVSNPTPYPTVQPTSTPSKVVVVTDNLPKPTPTPLIRSTPIPVTLPTPTPQIQIITPTIPVTSFRFTEIKSKISEAKREMSQRPIPTAMTNSFLLTDVVRLAFYDYDAKQIDYLVLTKDAFLKRGATYSLSTTYGKTVNVTIIRANGVNTPVMVTSQNNKSYLPLIAQYPVVRNGKFIETAYYISTHPGIVTPEVVTTGKLYMKNQLDSAREKLRERGVYISPLVTDIAERLAIVEHIDPARFWKENQLQLFNEVYALYALNEGQTYRYAVSSAGAGGMVQMIPSTYRMVRNRYPQIPLMLDFVTGMQNHPNAAQAMLLYMQMTWDDLIVSPTITEAILNNVATPAELLCAGYNSNPAKLPGYIKRGGTNWRNLIPRETQTYLQVNTSMNRYVPINTPRTK